MGEHMSLDFAKAQNNDREVILVFRPSMLVTQFTGTLLQWLRTSVPYVWQAAPMTNCCFRESQHC